MRLSEARRMALYNAIHDEVTNARLDLMRAAKHGKKMTADEIDARVAQITNKAWPRIKGALYLEGEA